MARTILMISANPLGTDKLKIMDEIAAIGQATAISQHIPYVIGMNNAIEDRAARDLGGKEFKQQCDTIFQEWLGRVPETLAVDIAAPEPPAK